MTHAFALLIAGRTAGIVARDAADRAYHFFAASPAYRVLEGVAFQEPEQAERAARKVHGGPGRARPKAGTTPYLTALEPAPCLPNPAI